MRVAVIGVPFNSAGRTTGEALAPAVLRDTDLIGALSRHHDVVDFGDVPLKRSCAQRDPLTQLIAPAVFADMVLATRDAVTRAYAEERMPIVIGGECPLLLGCLAAVRDVWGPAGLLFIDGHEDAYAPGQSRSGETADMALGFATGITRPDGVGDVLALLPVVRPEDVVIIGARDGQTLIDEGVASVADRIEVFSDDIVRRTSTARLMHQAMARVRREHPAWWLHVDLDALSSDALAAVRYPQPGGLSWELLEKVTERAFAAPGLLGWNITIYNPDLDPDRRQAQRIVQFIETASQQLRPSTTNPGNGRF